MGPTLTVPTLGHGPNEVPYPAAFDRVKTFLKVLLRRILDTKNEFVSEMGSMTALTELVHQLKMYARQEGPFSSAPKSDTLSWWRALAESNDAHVLVVRCWNWCHSNDLGLLISISFSQFTSTLSLWTRWWMNRRHPTSYGSTLVCGTSRMSEPLLGWFKYVSGPFTWWDFLAWIRVSLSDESDSYN